MAGALKLILAIFWLPLIYAQYGSQTTTTQTPTSTSSTSTSTSSSSTSSSTSTSAASAVQTVAVGQNGFTFSPDTLSVSPGSQVEFHFFPGNHSVVQAAFSNPCHPLNQSSIFSGFFPTASGGSSDFFTLTVNDTNPIWFYCAQIGHCQAGMVGVINPPSNGPNTLAAFRSAAQNEGQSTVPSAVAGGTLGAPSNASSSSSSSQSSSSTGSSTSSSATGAGATTSTTSGATSSPTSTSTSSPSPSPASEGSRCQAWSSLSLVMVLSVFAAVFIS